MTEKILAQKDYVKKNIIKESFVLYILSFIENYVMHLKM